MSKIQDTIRESVRSVADDIYGDVKLRYVPTSARRIGPLYEIEYGTIENGAARSKTVTVFGGVARHYVAVFYRGTRVFQASVWDDRTHGGHESEYGAWPWTFRASRYDAIRGRFWQARGEAVRPAASDNWAHVTLSTGGWVTRTTKAVINSCLDGLTDALHGNREKHAEVGVYHHVNLEQNRGAWIVLHEYWDAGDPDRRGDCGTWEWENPAENDFEMTIEL